MISIIKKFLRRICHLPFYVIADPRDNSISFSRALLHHIRKHAKDSDQATVMGFRIGKSGHYGFIVNPEYSREETILSDIQANDQCRTVGFEALCPTVAKIFYDYNIEDYLKPKILFVTPEHTSSGKLYYKIYPPRL